MMKLSGSLAPAHTPPLAGWAVHIAATPPGQPPAAPRRPLAFEPFLFLESAHQALQPHEHPVLACFLEDEAAGCTVAQFYVVLDAEGPGLARSPGQASFGGVQLAPSLPAAAVGQLLAAAEAALRARGQHQLALRPYASCYDPAGAATLAEALGQRGYTVALAEENCHLATDRDYEAHLHRSERRRLHRCRRAGLVVEQETPLFVPAAYDFLAACRHERGQSLALSQARVEELFRLFPQQHFLFSVRKPGTSAWAAIAVAVRVSERIFCSPYQASPRADNDLSPVVLLNEGVHAFARASGAAVLDLGTSTLPSGQPNESLLRFKQRLGCLSTPRLTWQHTLRLAAS